MISFCTYDRHINICHVRLAAVKVFFLLQPMTGEWLAIPAAVSRDLRQSHLRLIAHSCCGSVVNQQ